jgi:hypothetical protein
LKRLIPNLLEKVVFWPSTLPWANGNYYYFFTILNVMILHMVRNEYLRFGVYVDIQVSYKVLQLEIPKEVLILHQPLGF